MHGPRLLALARAYLGAEDQAQDCLQEAMIAAYRRIDSLSEPSALFAWLRAIVINCALMRLRKRAQLKEESIEALLPNFDERDCRVEPDLGRLPTPELMLQNAQSRTMVRDAIAALPETYRVVLLLRDIEGHSTREAAQMLGIEQGAAKVRLHRARAALKKLLEPMMKKERE